MSPVEHQRLIKANIRAALESGDVARAELLAKVYADLLALQVEQPEPRIPGSPINPIEWGPEGDANER